MNDNAEMREVIEKFCHECVKIQMLYDEYITLYGSGKERLDLLREIAGHFFFTDLQGVLIEYLYLAICRLTDPAKSFGSDNLTVKYILKSMEPDVRDNLRLDEISSRLHEYRDKIIPARHKVIGHLDYKAAKSGEIFGATSKIDVDDFWEALQEFVDKLHGHYIDGPLPLNVTNMRGAGALVEALKKAVHFEDMFKDDPEKASDQYDSMRYRDA